MDELLIDYEHESIYSSFMLTKTAKESMKNQDSPDGDATIYSIDDIDYSIKNLIKYPGEIKTIGDFKEYILSKNTVFLIKKD